MNEYNNSSNNYFSLLKTSKDISMIDNRIADRIIITQTGEMYFDYDENTRIQITSNSQFYMSSAVLDFSNSEIIEIEFDKFKDYNGDSITIPTIGAFVFDTAGGIGVIINKDDAKRICSIKLLTSNGLSIMRVNSNN